MFAVVRLMLFTSNSPGTFPIVPPIGPYNSRSHLPTPGSISPFFSSHFSHVLFITSSTSLPSSSLESLFIICPLPDQEQKWKQPPHEEHSKETPHCCPFWTETIFRLAFTRLKVASYGLVYAWPLFSFPMLSWQHLHAPRRHPSAHSSQSWT